MRFPVTTFCFLAATAASGLAAPAQTCSQSSAEKGDGTYYEPGLGACGWTNTASDMIVAVSHSYYDTYPGHTANPNDNPVCGKKITVDYKGKSVNVIVVDRCTGCNTTDVDLSPAAFEKLADLDLGRIQVTWTLH